MQVVRKNLFSISPNRQVECYQSPTPSLTCKTEQLVAVKNIHTSEIQTYTIQNDVLIRAVTFYYDKSLRNYVHRIKNIKIVTASPN